MKRGFSLIEIMVVIFILASLAGGIYVVYSPDKEEVFYANVRTSLREYARALQKWNNGARYTTLSGDFLKEPYPAIFQ